MSWKDSPYAVATARCNPSDVSAKAVRIIRLYVGKTQVDLPSEDARALACGVLKLTMEDASELEDIIRQLRATVEEDSGDAKEAF